MTITTNKYDQLKPTDILNHGPTKMYVDKYHWIDPKIGMVASYQIQAKDVLDHFGVFRGVDMIEAAAQTGLSACTISESEKSGLSIDAIKEIYQIAFLGVSNVSFYDFIHEGDFLVNFCQINKYKFRQMDISSHVYKVRSAKLIDDFFQKTNHNWSPDKKLPEYFQKIALIENVIGRAVKINKTIKK